MRLKLVIALAAAIAAGCAPGGALTPPGPAAAGILLVGNKGEDSLSFVDLATGRERGRSPTGRMPHEIAVSPDGRQAAVVSYGGKSIDIFDVASGARARTIDLAPNEGPHGLAWLADGRLVATTERSRTLTIVDTKRGDSVSAVATGQEGTHMAAVSPDGRRAFTANIPAGTVTVIDLAAGRKLRDVAVGGQPEGIALSPDGRTLWVADLEGERVQAFDALLLGAAAEPALKPAVNLTARLTGAAPGEFERRVLAPLEAELRRLEMVEAVTVERHPGEAWITLALSRGVSQAAAATPIEHAARRAGAGFPRDRTEIEVRQLGTLPLATVATGPRPIRVLASPDGRWIVTSDLGSGSLTVIDSASGRKAREIAVSGTEQAQQVTILFSSDGRRLYAAETGRDQVVELDFASGRILRRFGVGRNGDGLAIAGPASGPRNRSSPPAVTR